MDINKLLQKYNNREKPISEKKEISSESFLSLIEGQLNVLIEQQKKNHRTKKLFEEVKEKTIRFPAIKISELWGQVENGDRELIETILSNVEGNTVEAKIKSVNAFLDLEAYRQSGDQHKIEKILSNLLFAEIFASIITDYNASVSGFLFEAFLAALMGGTSIQVDDPEAVGAAAGSLPIEDVQLAVRLGDEDDNREIVPYSLKVLSDKGEVKGSFVNLVDYFLDPSEGRKTDTIVYLVAIKRHVKSDEDKKIWTGVLDFYEFTIRRDNFLDWIGYQVTQPVKDWVPYAAPYRMKVGKSTKLQTTDGEPIEPGTVLEKGTEVLRLEKVGTEKVLGGSGKKLYSPEQYQTVSAALQADEIDREVFNTLQDTKGYAGNVQWKIAAGKYQRPDYWIGSLNLSTEKLVEAANEYAQDLNSGLVQIFNALSDLTSQISLYFMGGGEKDGVSRKAHGKNAIENAKILKHNTEELIGD